MSAQALATGGARSHARKKTLAVAVVAASAMVVQLVGASAASAFEDGDLRGTRVTGRAWGAEAKLTHSILPNVSLGKVALQVLPCRPPGTGFNTVASVKLPGDGSLVSAGVVENRGTSSATQDRAQVTESSTVANVSLLGGLIAGRAVRAEATTTYTNVNGHRVKRNAGDVDFLDLKVDGVTISVDVAPNTTISLLDGAVRVVLNEQKTAGGRFQVNAIHVYVNDFLGYNGDIVVAHAETALADAPGHLSGYAFLSYVKVQVGSNVDPLLKALSGRQNVVYLPCAGGSRVSDAVNVTLPDGDGGHIATSATSRSTVNGTIDRTGGESHSTHTVEKLSLLNGRITADLVRTEANTESFNENGVRGVRSNGNSTLVNLKIDGVLQADVNGTATVNLPGIGFVRVNEKRCKDDQGDRGTAACTGEHYNAITVNALHVVVNTLNDVLPLKAEIIIGSAHSDVNF